MTQADKYFAKDGRYTERIIDLVMSLKNSPEGEATKIVNRFMENTKLHLAGMKLVESDMQYLQFCTAEWLLETMKAISTNSVE